MTKLLIIPCLFLLTACTSKFDINKEDLFGTWRTSEVLINGEANVIPFEDPDWAIMGLSADHYFQNYYNGQWSLENLNLTLTTEMGIFREYTIEALNENQLILEAEMTEQNLHVDLDGFSENETFIIRETYVREK